MIDPDHDLVARLVAASADCIGVLNLDGTIRFMNEQGLVALGATPGLDFATSFRAQAGGSLGASLEAVAEGRSSVLRLSRTSVDGTVKLWETSFAPLPGTDGSVAGVIVIARESAAVDAETTWRLIADASPGLLWTADVDGALDWVNTSTKRFTGLPTDRFLASGWLDIVHADDRPQLAERWSHAITRGEPLSMEARLRGVDGDFVWHQLHAVPVRNDHGTLTRWLGTAADIDALKNTASLLAIDNEQLEQDIFRQLHEVQRSQSRLQAYFDACPDYIYLTRLSNETGLTYEDVNPAAEALYRLEKSAIVGKSPHDLDDAATAAGIEANVRRCLGTGKPISYQIERTFAFGPTLFVQVVGAPIEYFNEEEGLVLFCGRDITEQRSVEEALRQSQKMEAVGQLTGGLAHDFNNLLTGITGSLDLLQVRVAQGRLGQVERYVTAARDAATRAAALTHRLLAFSRRQTLDPKATAVNRLVSDMEDLLRRTVGPEIRLDVHEEGGLWNVLVDASQLENTLLNLCINARDAMPAGGRITIETKNVHLDGRRADVRDLPAGDYVTLSVTDDGTGMPPAIVERIFDPFFTTKPIGSGTGLGLSMIYGFARQSGGQVRVHSTEGLGTTMKVLLPRHVGDADEAPMQAELAAAPRARDGETVLVVDDDSTVRMLVTEVLDDLGYSVIEASDGVAGVKLLQSSVRIDLLVTDVGLPGGVNGRQVAEAGRKSRPDLKVLFITGYAENAVLNHDHLEKGMQVLTKPFALETLATRIKSIIGDP